MPRLTTSIASSPETQSAYKAWKRFTTELAAKRPPSDGKEAEVFKVRAIDRFDPRYAVEVLSSDGPSFFGLREVLFAGFCAWVTFPAAKKHIRRSMLAEALWQLQETEQLAREKLTDHVFADVFARLAMIDQRFFVAIYHPLVEFSQIDRLLLRSGGVDSSGRAANHDRIKIAVSVLKFLHYHYTDLRNDAAMGKASLNKAYKLAREFGKELGGRGIDERHVLTHYNTFKDSAAFAYSAASISVSPNRNFLDIMVDQSATYEEHGHLVGELFGRAAYIRDLLGVCADKRDYQILRGYLTGIDPIPMPKVSLSKAASTEAATVFKRTLRTPRNG